jgi:Tfp pilus assembly protein PilF
MRTGPVKEAAVSPIPRSVLIVALLAAPALAGEPPTKEQVARWIKELGDDSYATREAASKRLWEAGEAAEAAVFDATKSPDPEVARRARALMNRFKWAIYATTPPHIAELIDRYRAANDDAGKQAAIKALFDAGPAGCATLIKIAAAEDEGVRSRVFQQIVGESSRAVPSLLLENKLDTLQQLLEIALAVDSDAAIPNYVACCLMRGNLDERIAVYKERVERPNSGRAAEVLVCLYRAKGDHAAARQAAAKAGRVDIEAAILTEARDWNELARLDLGRENLRPIEALGVKAAYQRLAGDAAAFEGTVKEMAAFAESNTERDWDTWFAAKALFLNDRPADAVALLAKHRRTAIFEVLCAQMRFSEAFALVDKVKNEPRPEIDVELALLQVLQARTWYLLGEKGKAIKLFDDLGARIKPGGEASWHDRLIEVEQRLGLMDLACDHCVRMLEITKNVGRRVALLDKAFPGRGNAALQWWAFLCRRWDEDRSKTMQRLRGVMDGSTRGKALDDLIGLSKVLHPDAATARWMLCIAEAYQNAGMDERAREYLDAAAAAPNAPEPHIHYGNYFVGQHKWELAAQQYGQAWESNRQEPLPLYLQGWALAQAGRKEEGKRLIELAHWLPLGNDSARIAFVRQLAKRRHREALRREAELLLRISTPGSFYAGEGFRQLAIDAAHQRDYLKTAAYHELAMLRCLRPQTSFMDTAAYLAVPHFVHRNRARGLADAGRIDEALKEAEICFAAMPGNSDLQTLLLPALEKHGRKQEADALFDRCYDLHVKLCDEYPNSAWAHNALAWLCASTRRNLDVAFDHARKAVALDTANPGYRDTLAEAYFQRGDAATAIEEIRRAIALNDKRFYFKKQLKRFEAGDPKAELPSPTDEE